MKNANLDSIVNKAVSQDLPNSKINEDHFTGFKEQCILIKQIIKVSMDKDIQS